VSLAGFGKIILHTGIDLPQCTSTYTGIAVELQYVLQYFQELQYTWSILQYLPRNAADTDTALELQYILVLHNSNSSTETRQ
jgi:hypothetical protein